MIIFNCLDKDNMHYIIDIELEGIYKRIEGLGYTVKITKEAKDFIVSKGFDVQLVPVRLREPYRSIWKIRWLKRLLRMVLPKATM